jgi:glutaredoxin
MFSTTWCPHCNRARQFFQANGLRVVDRDVDSDASANAELKRRIGRSAIPLIEIDGQQLPPGFSEQATLQAVAASVQRRLGVSSVRLVPASAPN